MMEPVVEPEPVVSLAQAEVMPTYLAAGVKVDI